MEEREQQIIAEAGKVFMRLGIRSVNMDDVAQHLRISKKTLYQYVKDKNELVEHVIANVCKHHSTVIDGICAKGLNAIDEDYEVTHFVVTEVGGVHPSVQFDLQKYHPKAWGILEHTEDTRVMACVKNNLRKGVNEGLYREDLDMEVVARLHVASFDVTWDGRVFPPDQFSFKDVLWKHFEYHIRGIASRKGLDYLMRKVQKERNTAPAGPVTRK
jgi:AcrR family transcriptional regulator